MKIFQTKKQLTDDDSNIILANDPRLHQVGTASTRAKLHDNPELCTFGIGAIVLGYVGRLQFRKNGNLLDNVLDFVFGALDIDNLDGNRLARSLIYADWEQ